MSTYIGAEDIFKLCLSGRVVIFQRYSSTCAKANF
jgi:hypothetical protein